MADSKEQAALLRSVGALPLARMEATLIQLEAHGFDVAAADLRQQKVHWERVLAAHADRLERREVSEDELPSREAGA